MSAAQEIVEVKTQSVAPAAPVSTTPAQLLAIAVQQGADLQKLEKLMDLQARWEANEARKAWVAAMSAFKANPPEIVKDKHVKFTTQKGVTEYDHATIGHVVESIAQALGGHGLSHRWNIEQVEGGRIKVTCVLTHVMGHSESTSLMAGADDSGGKNNIQAIGSTVTYLQRYTLLAATGLAAQEADDDGKGTETIERISESQAADLQCMFDEIYPAAEIESQRSAFIRYLSKSGKVQIEKLSDIPANMHKQAVDLLNSKRKQKQ